MRGRSRGLAGHRTRTGRWRCYNKAHRWRPCTHRRGMLRALSTVLPTVRNLSTDLSTQLCTDCGDTIHICLTLYVQKSTEHTCSMQSCLLRLQHDVPLFVLVYCVPRAALPFIMDCNVESLEWNMAAHNLWGGTNIHQISHKTLCGGAFSMIFH